MVGIPSAVLAAVLILARRIFARLDPEPRSAVVICRTLGCSPSQAYEMLGRLEEHLAGLPRAPGRPRAEAAAPADRAAVAAATIEFLMDHPGVIGGSRERRQYHPPFRIFVLSLLEPGRPGTGMTLEELAAAVQVPLPTLKDWLRTPARGAAVDGAPLAAIPLPGEDLPRIEVHVPGIAIVLREYPRWEGSFTGFCEHLRREHGLGYGASFIGTVLALAGLRRRKPRKTPVTPWSRGTFETMFPGAQWVGDGKQVVLEQDGEPHVFNLEALVDPASSALTGFRITDVEDEAAVLAAYAEAKETAGAAPIGVTLDNRPSNHTAGVREVVVEQDGASLLRSTPGRGQSKAPMEGAFGLFAQEMPELVVAGETARDRARSILQLAATAYARGRNGRRRRKLGGRTPAEVYQSARPTAEDVEAARRYLAELARRQEEMRRTREAKADPVRRQLLTEELARCGIEDPNQRLATELARYSLAAIVEGLAIFRAKQDEAVLPYGADPGRYLAGIIRNRDAQRQDTLLADHLLELRVRSGEISLAGLERQADEFERTRARCELPGLYLRRALEAQPLVDFRFWLRRLQKAVAGLDPPRLRRASQNWLVRTVTKALQIPRERRRALLAAITEGLATATAA